MTSTTPDIRSGHSSSPQHGPIGVRLAFVTREGIIPAGIQTALPRIGEHVRLALPRSGTVVVGRITFAVRSVLPGGDVYHAVVEVPQDPPTVPEWAQSVISTQP